ncbi:MAG: hypothetical protein R3F61_37275 [Myxococcota bacterium]
MDGAVSVCPVRDDSSRDGVRIQLVEDDPDRLEDFDAFYDGLPKSPVFQILDRDSGWVVFADAEEEPADLRRFGIEAIDGLERVSAHLRGLSADEVRVASTGGLELQPRYRPDPENSAWSGLADYLARHSPHGRDPRIDEAVAALRDPAPEIRRIARHHLVGTRPAATLTRTGELKLTVVPTAKPASGTLDRPPPRAAVLIPVETLKKLGPRERSAAAGLASVPLSVLDGLTAAGLPLVIEPHRRSRDARSAADRIRRDTGLPVEAATGGSTVAAAWSVSLAATGAATAFAAFTLSLIGIWVVPLLGFLLALGLMAMSARTGWTWVSQRSLLSAAQESDREAQEERARRVANPALARAWTALADARTALAQAELPQAPAADVRSVLKAAEAEIEALVRSQDAARSSGSGVSSAELLARIAEIPGTDPASVARRERLERSLADVEALEARRRHITDEANAIEAVLAEVTASLARWEADVGDEVALDQLLGAARRVSARRLE